MKKYTFFYPFLFALFPVLFLYSHNIEELNFRVIIIPLLLSLGITALVWLIFSLILKNRHKSALLTFIFTFMFFSYGHFYHLLNNSILKKMHLPGEILLIFWLALFAWVSFLVVKSKKLIDDFSTILIVFVSCLVLFSLIQIGIFHVKLLKFSLPASQMRDDLGFNKGLSLKKESLPDIYYLIFDRYARADTLRKYYGYNNEPFIDFLKRNGFYVASQSTCNYPGSYLSLSSSLNMRYHNYLLEDGPIHEKIIYRLLEDFKVQRLLKSWGYTYIHFGSWWEATKSNRHADINFKEGGLISLSQDFILKLLRTTVLIHLTEGSTIKRGRRKKILKRFEKLADVTEMQGPKFIFAHFLIPHKPFIFGPDGERISKEAERTKDRGKLYVAQLQFTNKKIKQLIKAILEKSKNPPVIIIQSDEGPNEEEVPERLLSSGRETLVKIRCKILNAYYLPGKNLSLLYKSISPINTFRLIFNLYFGTQYELLKDKTYIPDIRNKALIKTFKSIAVN